MSRLAVVTGCGALAFTVLECILSVVFYRGDLPLASGVRLATLAIALGAIVWLLLIVAGAAVAIAVPGWYVGDGG